MRISDWSSDVCSSDLLAERAGRLAQTLLVLDAFQQPLLHGAGGYRLLAAEGGKATHPIFEFPDIARPGVRHQPVDGLGVQGLERHAHRRPLIQDITRRSEESSVRNECDRKCGTR